MSWTYPAGLGVLDAGDQELELRLGIEGRHLGYGSAMVMMLIVMVDVTKMKLGFSDLDGQVWMEMEYPVWNMERYDGFVRKSRLLFMCPCVCGGG